jgi:hypothetical protein
MLQHAQYTEAPATKRIRNRCCSAQACNRENRWSANKSYAVVGHGQSNRKPTVLPGNKQRRWMLSGHVGACVVFESESGVGIDGNICLQPDPGHLVVAELRVFI